MQAINVLDHGFVRLVDYMGSDLSVVRSARVSYAAEWRAGEDTGSDNRLINYLWKHRHTTPFESVELMFDVKAPIFVLRQWHRHRTWSFNELSARYRELPEEFYIPQAQHVGVQSTSSKQARDVDLAAAGLDVNAVQFIEDLQRHSEHGFQLYRKHLGTGTPRELARLFLGLNTYSHQFAKIDLKNLLGFLDLRDDAHAQYEIRVFAQAMKTLAATIVPVCMEAYDRAR